MKYIILLVFIFLIGCSTINDKQLRAELNISVIKITNIQEKNEMIDELVNNIIRDK